MWVLVSPGLLTAADIPKDHPYHELIAAKPAGFFNGGSGIVTPQGTWAIGPVTDSEQLVVADIDPAMVSRARQTFDPAGHYARPDVFDLQVHRRRPQVTFGD